MKYSKKEGRTTWEYKRISVLLVVLVFLNPLKMEVFSFLTDFFMLQ